MIDPHLGHAAFRIGFYIAFVSGILSLLTESSSPERVISIFTFIISVLFLIVISIVVRWSNAMSAAREEKKVRDTEKGGGEYRASGQ